MGRAYAQAFAREGAKLALNDFNAETLAETEMLLKKQADVAVYAEAFDVADRSAFEHFAANVEQALGKAHVVINNAGVEGAVKPVWATSAADYERIMGTNFYGVVNGTQVFLPQLMANGEGAVVNVSSIFGLVGTPNSADYCASKFAVRGFTEALMAELEDSPIDAFLVHPGGVATNIVQRTEGREFAQRYLTTPPEAVAEHVIRCMRRGRVRIVFGESALRVWLASTLMPQQWLKAILWKELKKVTDTRHYPWMKVS